MRRGLAVVIVFVIVALFASGLVPTASAQLGSTNYCTNALTIAYGRTMTGQITNAASGATYCFDGRTGDSVTITVTVTSGNLAPLVFLADPTIDEVFVSNYSDPNPGRTVQLNFTLPETGQYLIIVSRVGVETGTTSGGFSLSLTSGTTGPGLGNPQDDIIFNVTCTVAGQTTQEIRGGIQFSFINVNPGFSYTVTVFGLDNFDPVLAVEHGVGIGTCNDDTPAAAGSELDVPGFGYVRANSVTAQVRFTTQRRGDPVNITVGAFGGGSGQFVMVIEGLAIQPSTELDGFVIRVPTSVAQEDLAVYMVSRFTSLDTHLQVGQGEGLNQAFDEEGNFFPEDIDFDQVFIIAECDDAGVGNCRDTPAFPARGTGVVISNGSSYIAAQTDAGIVLKPETSDPILYVFGSSNGRSSGNYAIMVIGHVPGENQGLRQR